MLTLFSGRKSQDCEGSTRRSFLKVGTLGLGSLTLPQLLASRAHAAENGLPVKDTAVVLLFLQGGPTHIETFDPKMTAPAEYRSIFGEVPTKLPGVTFGPHFQRLAGLADKLAVVRSFRHGNGSHGSASELVASGGNSTKATMGTMYARVAGASSNATGMPNNTVITPPAAGEQFNFLRSNPQRVTSVGSLPASYKAFDPSSGGDIIENMKMRIVQERLDDRRNLLGGLDRIRREADVKGAIDGTDRFQRQAFDVILGGVSEAFDLTKEDPRVVERYSTKEYAFSAGDKRRRQSPEALGHQMLLARRLVEAGCGFVTVTSTGWDMHGTLKQTMPMLGSAVDKASAAFIEDLGDRGLAEKVLFIITGEFGRTPKIIRMSGRDHWGNLCTLALAGGGLNMGQVIGRSDRTASVPDGDAVSVQQLMATVMNHLLDVGEVRIMRGLPSEVAREASSGTPIPQLV
jgi:uncharacterized protein (DUF1501 family)